MDWVPDLLGTPPRREENGGDQSKRTAGVEKRGLVEQTEIAVEIEIETPVKIEFEIESEIAVETESKIESESFETQSCEIEIAESEIGKTSETVELEIES